MRHCVRADLRALRKLERHNTWLQQNIPSRSIQQVRQRAVLELRSELCLRLGCSADRIEAVLDQQSKQI
jgi:hypothetical protein